MSCPRVSDVLSTRELGEGEHRRYRNVGRETSVLKGGGGGRSDDVYESKGRGQGHRFSGQCERTGGEKGATTVRNFIVSGHFSSAHLSLLFSQHGFIHNKLLLKKGKGRRGALRINKVVHPSDVARWRPGIQCLTLL